MKTCTQCHQSKPLSGFQERKKGTGKYKAECRACSSARAAAWNAANPERFKASQRRFAAGHAAAQARYRRRTYVPSEGFVALSARPHTLYRAYDEAGVLLYVGISADPKRRLAQHRREKPWWAEVARVDQEILPDREAAQAAETLAVQTENPLHNMRKRGPAVN